MKKRKIISFVTAVTVMLSMMTACGDVPEEDITSDTAVTAEQIESKSDDETVSETAELFGEDYDPFADDYDPYGGNGAFTVTAAHNTDNAAESTEAVTSAQQQSAETAAKASSESGAATVSENGAVGASSAEKKSDSSKSDKKTEKSSSGDVSLEITNSNSWNDGSNDFTQIDVNVKNNSDKVLNGWTVTINAGKNATVDQSWNCTISEKNGVLTITPVSYNTNIEPGQSGTFGLILKNPGKIDSSSAKVESGGFSAAANVNNNNNNNNNNTSGQAVNPNGGGVHEERDIPEPTTDDWLHTNGSKILDSEGREVWLTGINWFGYNTGTNTFDGLWTCDLETSIDAIADRGFNLLRIPISTELIKQWSEGEYPTANFNQATNYYLVGMNSLEIFDYVVDLCRADGIKIMIDIHSANTDASGHMANMWYSDKISEADYLNALGWIAKRYRNDDTIIAYDLENEPHGKAYENPRAKWDGSTDSDNWKYIAEKAAKKVLTANPNVLVMIEGIEIYPKDIKKNGSFKSTDMGDYYCTWWGGNLRGVKNDPVDLGKYNDKIVYSPHDYGPTVYEQPWFKGNYTFDSLYKDAWYDNWFYIQKENIAPLLIGEWGGYMSEPNITWMTYLRRLIKENRINHTFWCFNANSGDTGGLVKDDFVTWDEEKYKFVKEVLWQQNGKFVGLDHEIPLGKNGITLSEVKK
ncbi:MAG: cellulase family glycosylhydrolase [Oscillospiraceae bacterium]|nr:cellulase family glycosylhydrolase [Oscillospiraceae bacterium]